MSGDQRAGVVLVTGGNGFIGSHVAKTLHERGCHVRIVDIVSKSPFHTPICSELIVGNLCDVAVCHQVTRGAQTVLHFAAVMGGMGVIHSANDFPLYTANHLMTVNILSASVAAGVSKFLYASTACVYPTTLQSASNEDIALRETDIWNSIPSPQGLYGMEKLASEFLLQQIVNPMEIRIARFHNVYGPGGTWHGGREKAPAAVLRKAVAIKLDLNAPMTMELWGDGTQRRSFLWIGDCIDGILRLLWSDCKDPVNIGSDRVVTIKGLAHTALACVGIDPEQVKFNYDTTKPLGVAARNSNNDFVYQRLGWKPSTPLEKGMKKTAEWMEREMLDIIKDQNDDERRSILQNFKYSEVTMLQSDRTTYAILLPVTSRGSASPYDCLNNLATFTQSLIRTTWRDTHELGTNPFHVKVYLAIDDDDYFLLQPGKESKAETVLRSGGITDISVSLCHHPKGAICALWRDCARRAWDDHCDYYVLMGDDVVLQDEGWMRDINAEFMRLSEEENVPKGFGCVSFTDVSFPGMATFPIVHRTHMDIFGGQVVPDIFINQDGDPFLFQLYRRWGCSHMCHSRISNGVGGSDDARYTKQHAKRWTFVPLDEATDTAEKWLRAGGHMVERKLTIDIIVPSYRVDISTLDAILRLKSSNRCSPGFIIIVDNPKSPYIAELESKYAQRANVRIRANKQNLGASASRNRGLHESASEWVHFLDDDVVPRSDLLIESEKVIRAHPNAVGFIGSSQFPVSDSIFTTAIRLSDVIYFWDIAKKIQEDLPWGVTANLLARRNINDGVEYDTRFPKTGGGEDIDFCLKKRQASLKRGQGGFYAAPNVLVTHSWWDQGARSYWRFYLWARGDGELIKMYPEHTYRDPSPNSGELLLISAIFVFVGTGVGILANQWQLCISGLGMVGAALLATIIHDLYRHLRREVDRTNNILSTIRGTRLVLAVIESSVIRILSETGRMIGLLERGEIGLLGRRFDWFVGRSGNGPRNEEMMNSRQRSTIWAVISALILFTTRPRPAI